MYLLPLVAFASIQQPPDPNRLPIGRPGEMVVAPETMVDLRTGQSARPADVARAAAGHRFVYLGENHDQQKHHEMQAAIIEALCKAGRDVIVGFEQWTRPSQNALDPWTMGYWTEDEFIANADWKANWGMDYGLYRPIFEIVRRRKLPMVALNVPRDWVRRVGREGLGALTPEERAQLPERIDVQFAPHRTLFNALMGGHPPTGARGENIYAAQVLWDEAMADSALKYLARRPMTRRTVFVVVAGNGHVMYGLGINARIERRTGERGITVAMVQGNEPVTVSLGIGDFVFASRPSAPPQP